MNWPQYTYLALGLLGLGVSLANHGRPRKEENFWTTVISWAICMWLLWQGGFFRQGA